MELLVFLVLVVVAIVVQATVYKKHMFKRLGYRCGFSQPEAHEGDTVYFVETVHNRKFLPLPWLKVDMTVLKWLEFEGTKPVENLDKRYLASGFFLRSYQKTTRRWEVKCLKRGEYSIDTVTMVAGDFMGMVVESLPVKVNAHITVFPAVIALEGMMTSSNYLQGNTIVKRWFIDDPFVVSGAREYLPGDPMNRIHWTATAKSNSLMTKKNEYTSHISITVLLNIQSLEYEADHVINRDKVELGIKAAATIFDRALRFGTLARLGTNGVIPDFERNGFLTGEAAGRDHISQLLRLLAKLELRKGRDFDVYLESICGKIRNNRIFVITSYINDRMLKTLNIMKKLGNEIAVIIPEPDGNEGDAGGFETYRIFGGRRHES